MGRKRKRKGWSLVPADTVCCVSEDRVYDPDSEPAKSLMDQIPSTVADEVLIALRKSFSLTYPRNPYIEGLQAALAEIRRISVEALKLMPEVLADIGLQPIPRIMNDPVSKKVQVFLFMFARTADIDITVKVNGKRRRLLDLAEHDDGTALITTLRAVVTDTFREAHDEDQHAAVLQLIRLRIHAVLPAVNECLQAMEIEPIAECPLRETSWEDQVEPDQDGG